MRGGILILGGLLIALAVQAATALPASAWTPPTTITSETKPLPDDLELDYDQMRQAVRNDGSSVAAWVVKPAGLKEIHARLVKRSGALSGAETTVVSIPNTITIEEWDVTALGGGYVFVWSEFLSSGLNSAELKYRTLSSSGALGPVVSLGSSSVPSNEGLISYKGLSASAGGGFANLSWGYRSRTGPAANDCEAPFYSDTTAGACTVTQKATFARLRKDGSIGIPPTDLISRVYTSESTACYWNTPVNVFTNTVPSTGAATVVMNDSCRPQGGESTQALLFSRISAKGSISPAQLFALDYVWNTSMSADGTTVVSTFDQLYRIPSKGRASGPIHTARSLGKGWAAEERLALALPNRRAMVIVDSRKASGSKLVKGIWGCLVEANGSLGKPRLLFSRTYSASGPGTPDNSYLELKPSVGLGRETATLLFVATRTERISGTLSNNSSQIIALGINRKGGKVKGSQATLSSQSQSWNPTTEYTSNYAVSALDVAQDGTASALLMPRTFKNLILAPFTGSAEVSVKSAKLLRNPKSCGVNPKRC